jgi:hypothetical protein
MKPLNLSNSIYQRNGSKMGLDVNGGMLINNKPDSRSGIQKMVDLKKTIKRTEKVSIMSDAVAMGTMRGEMHEPGCGC